MCLCRLSQRRDGVLGIGRLVVFVSPMYIFLHNVQVMQYIPFTEVHVKRSVILKDRLGPDVLSAFWTKGQVLHRERSHLEVSGFSIVFD